MNTMTIEVPTRARKTTDKQKGLNDVVINRVHSMIDGKAGDVQATMQRLMDEGKIAQDYIAPLGVNLKKQQHDPVILFANTTDRVALSMPDGSFTLHDNAVGQLGERLGVPSRYLRTLARGERWERELCATIMNEHSSWTQRSRVLIRTVGTEVRGVLSDSYRRLNSVEIISAFVEQSIGQGAVIADAYMNDTKIWVETILPQPLVVPTIENGDVVIFAGARFSTSDYGDGAVDMRAFLLNGACLNGMVRESVMKQVHLGGKLPDTLALSQRTYELDTQTTVSAVKDLTCGLFNSDNLMQRAIEIQEASGIEVDMGKELTRLMKNGSLLKSESEEIQKVLMRNNPDDGVQGGSTLWKLTQGITAHARTLTPERSRELHELSGSLLNRIKHNKQTALAL